MLVFPRNGKPKRESPTRQHTSIGFVERETATRDAGSRHRNSQQVEYPDILAFIAVTVNRVARDQGGLVETTSGREIPRDEFTDEHRPNGE